ncbi:hypothetical protein TNCV_3511021 [Trichonephila clavipes]|nr:hypothetical protein TNCV_3511021 [Trichonephila clavipes]
MGNENRYLTLMPQRLRNMNGTLLQQNLCLATGTIVSTQKVQYRLHSVGAYARRPDLCVTSTERRIFIWREYLTRNNLTFVLRSVRFGGGGMTDYAGIPIDVFIDIHILQNGAHTGH